MAGRGGIARRGAIASQRRAVVVTDGEASTQSLPERYGPNTLVNNS
jgi:hypothetical protein